MEGDTVITEISTKWKQEKDMKKIIQNLQLSSASEKSHRIQQLIRFRRDKKKNLRIKNFKDILQQDIKPGDAVPRIFSNQKPISAGEKFLNEKAKRHLLTSNRAFSKKPNIISGQYRNRLIVHNQKQIKDMVRRKFLDYDRVITEQIGPLRISMRRKTQAQTGYQTKSPIIISKQSEGLFSTFQSNNYNFYTGSTSNIGSSRRERLLTEGSTKKSEQHRKTMSEKKKVYTESSEKYHKFIFQSK